MSLKPRPHWLYGCVIFSVLAGMLTGTSRAESLHDQQVIELWPGVAPGSQKLKLQERILDRNSNPSQPDRAISGISHPSLQVFVPGIANGASLVVIPGGSYRRQAIDKEGTDIARFFAGKGLTVFILKYRLPSEGHQEAAKVPLQDAQRTIRILRSKATHWGLDPAKVMVMGFSAGGHLASTLATQFSRAVYAPVDECDVFSARPDGIILLYPVISMETPLAHEDGRSALLGSQPTAKAIFDYSNDRHVRKDSPPTLMIMADDDASVSPEHCIRYYQALHRLGVSAELHIYAKGKHGFGLRNTVGLPVADWPKVALNWMSASGFLLVKLDKEK